MNTKIKIAAGVLAGLIAGVTLVGTAVAAPRMMTAREANGYGMMQATGTSGTYDRATTAEMDAFMSRYVAANGTIDMNRMRAEAASGRFNPPTIAQMNAFMSRYVTADGSIDRDRMHSDVTNGEFTPPCFGGDARANSGSAQGSPASYLRGPAMMQVLESNNGDPTGYNMMGSTY
jgi:hypothetical protein